MWKWNLRKYSLEIYILNSSPKVVLEIGGGLGRVTSQFRD